METFEAHSFIFGCLSIALIAPPSCLPRIVHMIISLLSLILVLVALDDQLNQGDFMPEAVNSCRERNMLLVALSIAKLQIKELEHENEQLKNNIKDREKEVSEERKDSIVTEDERYASVERINALPLFPLSPISIPNENLKHPLSLATLNQTLEEGVNPTPLETPVEIPSTHVLDRTPETQPMVQFSIPILEPPESSPATPFRIITDSFSPAAKNEANELEKIIRERVRRAVDLSFEAAFGVCRREGNFRVNREETDLKLESGGNEEVGEYLKYN